MARRKAEEEEPEVSEAADTLFDEGSSDTIHLSARATELVRAHRAGRMTYGETLEFWRALYEVVGPDPAVAPVVRESAKETARAAATSE